MLKTRPVIQNVHGRNTSLRIVNMTIQLHQIFSLMKKEAFFVKNDNVNLHKD